jgi:hypothetical protein
MSNTIFADEQSDMVEMMLMMLGKDGTADTLINLGVEGYSSGDYEVAYGMFEACAAIRSKHQGACMNNVGHFHFHGLGVPQDYSKTIKWLEKAKINGFQDADLTKMLVESKKELKIANAKRIADAKKAEKKREEKRIADAKKAEKKREEKRIADAKKTLKSIDSNLRILKNHLKKLQDLELDSLKVKADKLISEIENNTDSTQYQLRNSRDRLLNLNSLVASTIKTEEKRIADAKKAEEKRIADAKKAEEKRIADAKKTQKSIDSNLRILKNHLKKLQDLELDSLKVEAEQLISEVDNNTNSELSMLKNLVWELNLLNSSVELKIKTEERRLRNLGLKDYPGFKDLKPGLTYEDVLEICPLRKNAWVKCYGINNIKFKGKYQSKVLKELILDMGPIVDGGGFYLDLFGDGDSNIFIKMKNTFDKKYTLDHGYSERDRQLFNESEKYRLYRVYSKGQVVLEINRKEKDYSNDLWLYIHYLDADKAKSFLEASRPVRASTDDF